MAARCHFVVAAALVSIARSEQQVEERFQGYLEMRQHVAAFGAMAHVEVIEGQDEATIRDLALKMSTLYVFDFEAAVSLESWDELGEIIRTAKVCRDVAMFKAMGDCLLRSQAPGKGIS